MKSVALCIRILSNKHRQNKYARKAQKKQKQSIHANNVNFNIKKSTVRDKNYYDCGKILYNTRSPFSLAHQHQDVTELGYIICNYTFIVYRIR